MIPSNFDIDV